MGARTATVLPVAATVGRNVAALRRWRGLSLRDLETRTGRAGHRITRDRLAQVEHGINRLGTPCMVTVDQLVALAAVFKVTPQELMTPGLEPTAMSVRSASAPRT
jgi:transcriptional regulator with XRE-family HTH domain